MDVRPPEYALRFLRWFCRADYLEEIEGDLIELFEQQSEQHPTRAKWNFSWQVLRHFRPDFIRTVSNHPIIHTGMYQHYLKVAWRNLVRQGQYTLINLSGLTIGMTCFILIALYIQYEFSYDRQHEKADRIYRVVQQQKGNTFQGTDLFAGSPQPLAPGLMENFPEVEAAATISLEDELLFQQDEFYPARLMYAGKKIFDIFTIPILTGSGAGAMDDPNAVLLCRSLAEKIFGSEDPLGKTLTLRDDRSFSVKGIFEDMSKNRHFTAEAIIPVQSNPYFESDFGMWDNNNYFTYLTLAEGYDYRELENKLNIFDDQVIKAYAGLPFRPDYFLQPLKDIHLHSRVNFEPEANGDIRYVYLFGAIGLIILLLASVNYMNLATARSARRAREVGVRKVMGAQKGQLVGQLLGESFILTLFSFSASVLLAWYLLPQFNRLLDQAIPFNIVGNPWILGSLLLSGIMIGVLSGLYPALVLSAPSPVVAMKGQWLGQIRQGLTLRNALIVGQFTAAVVLAVSSVLVYQQLQFIRHKKLGFNREHIVYVPIPSEQAGNRTAQIREKLMLRPQIRKVTVSTNLILSTANQGIVDQWEGNDKQNNFYCYRYYVDEHFLDLFEIPLVAGRNLSPEFPTDSTESYLLNQAAVQAIGWTPETALGKSFNGGRVVGVVKDFNFQPMKLGIEPLYLRFRRPDRYGYMSVKLEMDDLEKTLSYIRSAFMDAEPKAPFEYHFLDDSFEQLYAAEKRLGLVFNIFTFLALFIACIGLFGLVSYQIAQRGKEISIRKVLGASAIRLVELLSMDFLRLVLVALVLAVPIAWYAMHRWLDHFAYRIEIRWWVFLLVAGPSLAVALLTVGIQSYRAALANPVEALKDE